MCQLGLHDRCCHERLALHLLLALAAHVHRIKSLIIGEDIRCITGKLVSTLVTGTAVIIDRRGLLVILLGVRLRILSGLLVSITCSEVCLLLCCFRRKILLRFRGSLRLVSIIVVDLVVVLILRRESAAEAAAVSTTVSVKAAIIRTSALRSVGMIRGTGSLSALISAGSSTVSRAYESRCLTCITCGRCFYHSRTKLRSFLNGLLRCFFCNFLRGLLRSFLCLCLDFFLRRSFFLFRLSRSFRRFLFFYRFRCLGRSLLFCRLIRFCCLCGLCCGLLRSFFGLFDRSCLRGFLRSYCCLFLLRSLSNSCCLFLRRRCSFFNRRFLGLFVYTADTESLRSGTTADGLLWNHRLRLVLCRVFRLGCFLLFFCHHFLLFIPQILRPFRSYSVHRSGW